MLFSHVDEKAKPVRKIETGVTTNAIYDSANANVDWQCWPTLGTQFIQHD